MQHIVIAVYDHLEQAQDARAGLEAEGFAAAALQLHSANMGEEQILRALADEPGAQQRELYAEAIRRGRSVLSVQAADDAQRERAVSVLNRFRPVQIGQRVEYGSDGPGTGGLRTGYDERGAIGGADEIALPRSRPPGNSEGLADVLPPAGSSAGEGAARVYAGTSAEALQQDRVRTRRNGDFADTLASVDDADYRAHWRRVYGPEGGRYEDYDAAYRYGAMAAAHPCFRDYRWEEAEPGLRNGWEARHHALPWEKVRAAVRYGAGKITGDDGGLQS